MYRVDLIQTAAAAPGAMMVRALAQRSARCCCCCCATLLPPRCLLKQRDKEGRSHPQPEPPPITPPHQTGPAARPEAHPEDRRRRRGRRRAGAVRAPRRRVALVQDAAVQRGARRGGLRGAPPAPARPGLRRGRRRGAAPLWGRKTLEMPMRTRAAMGLLSKLRLATKACFKPSALTHDDNRSAASRVKARSSSAAPRRLPARRARSPSPTARSGRRATLRSRRCATAAPRAPPTSRPTASRRSRCAGVCAGCAQAVCRQGGGLEVDAAGAERSCSGVSTHHRARPPYCANNSHAQNANTDHPARRPRLLRARRCVPRPRDPHPAAGRHCQQRRRLGRRRRQQQ